VRARGGDEPDEQISSCPLREAGVVQVRGIHHVSIIVDDVEAALRFYTDVLGLAERSDRPGFGFGGAWLDAGSQQIHLIEGAVPPAVGQHLALQVDDLDAVVAELRDQGIDASDPSPVGTGRQAFCTDPSGNLVELHQPA
jgi:glyoxylase I family protein